MKITAVLYGVITAFALTFLLVLITAAAAYTTGISEGTASICAYAAAALAVFFGGYVAAMKAKRRVLVHSMSVSIVYAAAVIAASLMLNGKIGADVHSISMLSGIMLTGFLAAVVGTRGKSTQ